MTEWISKAVNDIDELLKQMLNVSSEDIGEEKFQILEELTEMRQYISEIYKYHQSAEAEYPYPTFDQFISKFNKIIQITYLLISLKGEDKMRDLQLYNSQQVIERLQDLRKQDF
ncbi:hypothetical protein PPERSA_12836 [Pseudocohnilembus persalinus]|uniref:Uncharacterized protein n=1 Tax=Pseudocohnilembus persalinus TaxID=266149 RepID=A0A0V0QEG4_PSEPJ|nr:hypothetical protein PPERSA_12836 [Pseudocohnilembus persalinus]|eukprot:KRX00617.1 hypothetical protein PPERSA_12836 [Pseudocohnilembus persalinus]